MENTYSATSAHYDPDTKIWAHPLTEPIPNLSIGEIIWQKLTSADPDKIVEINYDNGKELTIADLKTLSVTCAKNLQNLGIKKDDIIVFICNFNSFTTPVIVGNFLIGAITAPIYFKESEDHIKFLLSLLDPSIIVYEESCAQKIQNIIKEINLKNLKYELTTELDKENSINKLLFEDVEGSFEVEIVNHPEQKTAAAIASCITPDSNVPAIFLISHENMFLEIRTLFGAVQIKSGSIYGTSQFGGLTTILIVLYPIFFDCTRIFSKIFPIDEISGNSIADLIIKYNVSNFMGLGSALQRILEMIMLRNIKLDHVETIMPFGEKLSIRTQLIMPLVCPNSNLISTYGVTECGVISQYKVLESKPNCVGKLVDGISVKIINSLGAAQSPNVHGEICIKMPREFLKYLKNEKLNKAKFTEDGWFKTGDYGKYDEQGNFYIYCRLNDLIQYDGRMIIPSLIEQRLEEHLVLQRNCLLGIRRNDSEGEDLILFSIPKDPNMKIDKHELNKFLEINLPNDQIISIDEIYFLKEFPLQVSGRIDKGKLKENYLKGTYC